MVNKKAKRFKKAIGLAALPFVFVALLLVPNALGQSSDQQGDDSSSGFTTFTANIVVDNKPVACSFTVTDANHAPLKDKTDHYVMVGDPATGNSAIDRNLTGDVVIPQQVQDDQGNVYDVTAVGEYAFSYCAIGSTGLKDNKSITDLGICSYFNCESLTRTDLETSAVTRVNTSAFANSGISDTGLANNTTLKPATFDTNDEYSSSVELGHNCFGSCNNLKTTGLENNNVLTEVRDRVFQMCENLESTGLENNTTITKVGAQAFCECPSLTKTGLENNKTITSLGSSAFQLCTGLTDTGLANSAVQTLADGVFYQCSNLKSTSLDKNDSVESIGQGAFTNTALTSTGLSNNTSVKTLGPAVFRGLSSLTDTGLAGNSTLESVGIDLFRDCISLTDTGLNTNTGIQEVSEDMFMGCVNLAESGLTQNKSIGKIGQQAFVQCGKLGSESTEFSNAGDLVLNGRDGKLDVSSYAFYGTAYTRIYDYCDVNGLTSSDDMFGRLTSANPIIIGLPAKSQITNVYVPRTDKWNSVASQKIGGVVYSSRDSSLVVMDPISGLSADRKQLFNNANVVEMYFNPCEASCKIDLKYGSDGQSIGTFDVQADGSVLSLESQQNYLLRNYQDTLVVSINPDKIPVFPEGAQKRSYNFTSGELGSCDMPGLNFNVKFDANRGSGDMAPQKITVQKDGGTALNSNEFEYAGHHFAGWNTRSDGKGTQIDDQGKVNDLCDTQFGTVTLYAQWKTD